MGSDYWEKNKRIDLPDDPYGGGVIPRTWQEVWKQALTNPSYENFLDLLRSSDITLSRAAMWIYIGYLISYILSSISQLVWGTAFTAMIPSQTTTSDTGAQAFSSVGGLICSPIIAGIFVIFWIFGLGITHVIATMLFSGRGSLDQLAFLVASFQAPIFIISGLLYLIPVVGLCLALPLGLYSVFLTVIALNAAHQIGWVQSIITLILPLVVIFGCAFLCIVLIAGGAATSSFILPLLSLF